MDSYIHFVGWENALSAALILKLNKKKFDLFTPILNITVILIYNY